MRDPILAAACCCARTCVGKAVGQAGSLRRTGSPPAPHRSVTLRYRKGFHETALHLFVSAGRWNGHGPEGRKGRRRRGAAESSIPFYGAGGRQPHLRGGGNSRR